MLVKAIEDDALPAAREFLLRFENDRKRHREMHAQGSQDKYSSIYSRYDALNRSTNDGVSHIGRVGILAKEFNLWANSRGLHQAVNQKRIGLD